MIQTDQSIENVTRLTDVEICQKIAELKGLTTYMQSGMVRVQVVDGDDYYFNPIDNKEQAFDLVDVFGVLRDYEPYDMLGFSWWVHEAENPAHTLEYDSSRTHEQEITPSKAVCLAIITAHFGKIWLPTAGEKK